MSELGVSPAPKPNPKTPCARNVTWVTQQVATLPYPDREFDKGTPFERGGRKATGLRGFL